MAAPTPVERPAAAASPPALAQAAPLAVEDLMQRPQPLPQEVLAEWAAAMQLAA